MKSRTTFASPARLRRRADEPPGAAQMSELVVWYDGSCPLCCREIELMRRLDRNGSIRFVDAATEKLASCPVDRANLLARFHAREDGVMLSGAAAFAALCRCFARSGYWRDGRGRYP